MGRVKGFELCVLGGLVWYGGKKGERKMIKESISEEEIVRWVFRDF